MKRTDAVLVFGLFSLVACVDRKKGNPDGATRQDAPAADAAFPTDMGPVQGGNGGGIPDLHEPVDSSSVRDLPVTSSDAKPDGALAGGTGDSGKGGSGDGGSGGGSGGSVPAGTGGDGGAVTTGSGGRTGLGGSLITSTGGSPGSGGATAPSPLDNGSPCTVGTTCASGVCVDGVCCNKTCSGCNACTRALTGQADGSCAPVLAGSDPHDTCTDETARNQCGDDGACDGKGACRKVATSHQCSAATCVGATFTAAAYCNGTGACASAAPQNCGTNKTCNSSNQCSCGTGYKDCNGICIANSGCCSSAECAGGKTCQSSACTCANGTKDCNGTCIASSGCCGDGDCSGGKTCNSGHQCLCSGTTKDCNGTCIAASACCSNGDCSGGKVCDTTSRQCACPLGGVQASCGTCLSWDFESGASLSDTNGWVRNSEMWPSSIVNVSRVTSPTYAGSHSLAVTVQNSGGFALTVPLCSTADLSNLNFSAQMRLHDLGGASSVSVDVIMYFAPDNQWAGPGWVTARTLGTHSWFPILGGTNVPWPSSAGSLTLFFQTTGDWSGTVYIDDIVFSP